MKGLRKHERRVKELTYQVRAMLLESADIVPEGKGKPRRLLGWHSRTCMLTPYTSRIKRELLIIGIHQARVVREAFTRQHRRGHAGQW